ncbi:MAG: hypothetical protein EZS26_000861 [Candidatus Ordinivivax streblomastigis]|uniref:Glycosyltransferase RgtA/B/C/D-like domain-containing protein n=1 Tax=Candidatus Ordinivivax streblomastigis TaxID=2540710 RepID=A0A5M8P3R9_9BACT|nr:MAG: hypothetical protein EZS26_000861 [Candidatus Ordinivivax streblomastigis]
MSEDLHYGPFYQEVSQIIGSHYYSTATTLMALLLMFILVCWTLFFSEKDTQSNRKSNVVFIGLGILTLFIFRSLTFYQDLCNPDEGMHLTAVLNILSDSRLWISADTTTLGPICYLLIAFVCHVIRFIGIDCDVTFFLCRFINTMLIIGTFCFFYRICIKNLSLKLSRVICLFFIFFFAFNYHFDLQAYNTESVYVFLITVIIYLTFKIKTNINYWLIVLTGVLCGLLPYVKLQTIPMAFVCILWILYTIWDISRTYSTPATRLITKRCIVFLVAILIPTILLVIYCSAYEHGLSRAYLCYVKNASAHVTPLFSTLWLYNSCKAFYFFASQGWYNSLFILIMLSMTLFIFVRPKWTSDWFFSFLLVLLSLFAVVRVGSPFQHYMLFLSIPSLLFLITTLRIVFRSVNTHSSNFFAKIGNFLKQEHRLSIFLVILWLFLFRGFAGNVREQTLSTDSLVGNNKRFSDISRIIMQQTTPDDYILVWGWEMRIHVYTNRRSATAQSNIERIWGNKYKNYPHENVDNFIHDIKTNKPKLIVDVVAPRSFGFEEEKYALENHTEVWGAIKNDYELTDIYPVDGGSFKIYTRKK